MIRALLGGSFDPVHLGHVAMARHVLADGLAAAVHVVPAWLSPHKRGAGAPPQERLAMVRLAFAGLDGVQIDAREIRAGHSCRTVTTLAALRDEHPADHWRLVVGADHLPSFRTWAEPDRILRLAELVVLGRVGHAVTGDAIRAAGLPEARVVAVPEFDQPVSSTAVRAMLAAGPGSEAQLVAGGLPAPVAAHIVAHRLYRPDRNGEDRVPDPD
jgi:nicotinate-nucleotide adenylyltransferase